MPITVSQTAEDAEIRISGRFTFSDGGEFRKQLSVAMQPSTKALAIHLGDVTFMDSSGLGMLMVALKECQQRGVGLKLIHPQGDVKNLLHLTKSYDRFTIVE